MSKISVRMLESGKAKETISQMPLEEYKKEVQTYVTGYSKDFEWMDEK